MEQSKKGCYNCKHELTDIDTEPCKRCLFIISGTPPTNWEPVPIPTTESPAEGDDFVNIDSLLSEFKRQGFDTSNWDGDEGAEKAIVNGVCNSFQNFKAKYEKCIATIKKFDPGIIGMYDL